MLDLLLMGVLRHGPAHGYAIISALRDRSDGEFDLAEGTVYPALHRLEQAGLIDSRPRSRRDGSGGPTRSPRAAAPSSRLDDGRGAAT